MSGNQALGAAGYFDMRCVDLHLCMISQCMTHGPLPAALQVHRCVAGGGKVLIPVGAAGRAQELVLLVQEAWQRLGLTGRVPLYHSGLMASRANALYRWGPT
jgi:hypothetical protein